jgi:hypothetical protein
MGGLWFCIGNGVVNRSMVVHERANGQWELQGSSWVPWWIKGHGTFGAHEEGGLLGTHAPLSKDYLLSWNFKSKEPATQN